MKKIDAHQHFWQYDPVRDAWIDETMATIQRDFLPTDLAPVLQANGIDGCVAVQAAQLEAETEFLLGLAHQHDIIRGVVGWVDLLADDAGERLAHFAQHDRFKGVRHIAQAEADDFLARADVQHGIRQLTPLRLTYDILVYAHQLPAAVQLAQALPDQSFVLDHIAKPQISAGLDDQWVKHIRELAACPNVSCKLSGMVTETTTWQWQPSDFRPFLDVVLEAFGTNRLMYGSDWPVCLLAAEYPEQLAIVEDYISTFSADERARIMGENARSFYRLSEQ